MIETFERVCERVASRADSSTRFGVDAVHLAKFERCIDRGGRRFLDRILRPIEIAETRGAVPRLASRVAAKEAFAKALGTGLRGVGWLDLEVVSDPYGAPTLELHGRARQIAHQRGAHTIALSISHDEDFAFAAVIVSCDLTHSEMER